jgi:serine/threonine protein kinase
MNAAEACRREGLRLTHKIGDGGFSDVYAAKDEHCGNERVAVKITKPTRAAALDCEQELVALEQLSDLPHVVGMRRHFRCGDRAIVVMELADGDELFEIVKAERRLSEDHARGVIQQVLETITAMHQRGWVHRDLKLENVITDTRTNTNKIIDFGFAVRQAPGAGASTTGVIGTAHYVAPEVVWRSSYDGRAVDMFAVGVMLYVMLYGQYPFGHRSNFGVGPRMRQADKMSVSANYCFPRCRGGSSAAVSEEAKGLIRSLLLEDPAQRPTAEEAIRHSWVRHPTYATASATKSGYDSFEDEPNEPNEPDLRTSGGVQQQQAPPAVVHCHVAAVGTAGGRAGGAEPQTPPRQSRGNKGAAAKKATTPSRSVSVLCSPPPAMSGGGFSYESDGEDVDDFGTPPRPAGTPPPPPQQQQQQQQQQDVSSSGGGGGGGGSPLRDWASAAVASVRRTWPMLSLDIMP